MNPINHKKLLNSKWTAVVTQNKEKHFMITDVEFDELGKVVACTMEAIISKREFCLSWRDLKDSEKWRQGWK
ncbi:TIGR02450 family Trp-rich protein [Aliiglaciecola litoralis]|uniref:TIGR02450 family Trp-rich protein n=1 Tax=Aliiglaciecola litoralis TaxID=582857 RepID=A0ABP3WQB0_9ALTE